MSANVFDENKLYQFGINSGGTTQVIGSGTVDSNAVRFHAVNRTDDFQQWSVIHVNSTSEFPYRLKLRRSGFFLSTHCDGTIGSDCSKGTVNRATLIPVPNPEDVPDAGSWKVVASADNDGSYHWYNKSNGTRAWLDALDSVIFMNRNSSSGEGGSWVLSSIADLSPSTTALPSPTASPSGSGVARPSTSHGLSGGAIGGIVVGVVAALILFVAAIGHMFRRRRARTKTAVVAGDGHDRDEKARLEMDSSTYSDSHTHSSYQFSDLQPYNAELSGEGRQPSELDHSPSPRPLAELAGS